MSGDAQDWDLLLHRYLEGTLSPEETEMLNARLKKGPRLARRLAEMSVDTIHLKEMGGAEDVSAEEAPAPATPRRSWPKGSIAAAAAILVAVLVALVAWAFRGESQGQEIAPAPAASIEGFEGRVGGTIVRGDEGPVGLRVEQVSADDEAVRELLHGRVIRVEPDHRAGERGESPDRVHRAFLGKLREGQFVVLEVTHAGRDRFRIMRLTDVQKEWAGGDRERDPDVERDERERPRPRPREGDGDRRREGDREREGDRRREGDRGGRERREGDRGGEEQPEREEESFRKRGDRED